MRGFSNNGNPDNHLYGVEVAYKFSPRTRKRSLLVLAFRYEFAAVNTVVTRSPIDPRIPKQPKDEISLSYWSFALLPCLFSSSLSPVLSWKRNFSGLCEFGWLFQQSGHTKISVPSFLGFPTTDQTIKAHTRQAANEKDVCTTGLHCVDTKRTMSDNGRVDDIPRVRRGTISESGAMGNYPPPPFAESRY